MKFYFDNMCDILWNHDEFKYYSEYEIKKICLYTEEEVKKEEKKNSKKDFWPVSGINNYSWEPLECKNEEEARKELMLELNQGVFERQNDF